MKDRVFSKPIKKQFEFDEEVASVFDDMIARSVPFYKEVLDLVSTLVVKNSKEGSIVYDLGCSTGSTLIEIFSKSDKELNLIGLDNSSHMIERAKKKAKAYGAKIDFIKNDILDFNYKKADCFISNYTFQFIRPLKRDKLVKKIYDSLNDGGILIFSEKVISEDKILNKQLIDIYFDFKKKQGYSEFEIMQKREALENVLVPYSVKENEEMIKNAGFKYFETVFRWANFATFFARK
ncbi:carboxy-S-adenosyl-L-methionine synthase CmoA [Nitrosophilus kaiyonis]|uniref:carboxy-S-adenosyl-L-methionine synthase CmoA n=1 Tax=Nitrosophilus kaiyonis TaxID=2930200 RepID=UPI002492E3A2|nr:carboxy-S-adenosyl-L-methionine synthase CmoA [Nitrosophilus kaiyonis]